MKHWAGHVCRREDSVDSTNKQARLWAKEGAPHGAVIMAKEQTEGRGRKNRIWASAPGTGLWMSMVLRPNADAAAWPLLSFAAALAVADSCEKLSSAPVQLKWPNDVLSGGKKLAGILLEKEGGALILGIGINVSQAQHDFPESLQHSAISLRMISKMPVTVDALMRTLLENLEYRIDAYQNIMEAYRKRCITIGSRVSVEGECESFEGTAESINDAGGLLVRDAFGAVHTVYAGDVSIRGENGYV